MIILSLIPLLKYLVISAVPLQCDNPEPHISTDDRNDDLTNYAGWLDFEDM